LWWATQPPPAINRGSQLRLLRFRFSIWIVFASVFAAMSTSSSTVTDGVPFQNFYGAVWRSSGGSAHALGS
jgi:hypothetical protein